MAPVFSLYFLTFCSVFALYDPSVSIFFLTTSFLHSQSQAERVPQGWREAQDDQGQLREVSQGRVLDGAVDDFQQGQQDQQLEGVHDRDSAH